MVGEWLVRSERCGRAWDASPCTADGAGSQGRRHPCRHSVALDAVGPARIGERLLAYVKVRVAPNCLLERLGAVASGHAEMVAERPRLVKDIVHLIEGIGASFLIPITAEGQLA